MGTGQPAKVVGASIQFQVGFLIRNQGPGIAKDLFINAMIISMLGDNCELSFRPSKQRVT